MLVICALAGIAKGIIYKSPIDFIAAALLLTALVIGIVQRMKKAA